MHDDEHAMRGSPSNTSTTKHVSNVPFLPHDAIHSAEYCRKKFVCTSVSRYCVKMAQHHRYSFTGSIILVFFLHKINYYIRYDTIESLTWTRKLSIQPYLAHVARN